MIVAPDLPAAVGNTPLIRLRRASEATGCEIWGKAEFMNPGQSVKDRAALWIIRDAVARGALRPGGTIVEGTAGNTGIGLALIGAAMGFRTVIVIPDTQSQEKKDTIRLAGAELVEVPAVPYRDPNNYVRYSGRLAEELAATDPNGAVWANQFDNVANRQAHIDGTAPEIWEQTGGRIDGFICAVGSGGTLAGVAAGLRARDPEVKIGLADPEGAALWHYYAHGELKAEGTSITEGIGQGRITANLEGLTVDMPYRIPDAEAMPIVFDLLRDEGLCMGASTGINVAGAIRMARDLGPGHTIVTILCDYGTRYQSKLFNPDVPAREGPAGAGLARARGARHPRCLRRTDPRRAARRARARGSLLLLALAVAALAQAPAEDDAERAKRWDAVGDQRRGADQRPRHARPRSSRRCASALVAQRSEALAAEQERQPAVDELNQRLQALGPPPAEGAEEAPEIAALRARPDRSRSPRRRRRCSTAQEAYRRTDALIAHDRPDRARPLLRRADEPRPEPAPPATWLTAMRRRSPSGRSTTAPASRHEFAEPVERQPGAAPAAAQHRC